MDFVKKNLFWLCAGAILLGELVFGVVWLRAKFSENAREEQKVETSRKSLDRLLDQRDRLANDDILKAAEAHRDEVEENYLETLLFLLERDYRIERIVPPPPSGSPFDLSKTDRAARQQSYREHVRALRADAEAAGITLPNETSIAEAKWVRVPEAAQIIQAFKMHWLQQACVEAMKAVLKDFPKARIAIHSFSFSRGIAGGTIIERLRGTGKDDKEYSRIIFKLRASMRFEDVPVFISRLLEGDTTIDVRSFGITKKDIAVGGGGAGDAAATAADMRLAGVEFDLEAFDFDVCIEKVVFAKPKFKNVTAAGDWLKNRRSKLGNSVPDKRGLQKFLIERIETVKPKESANGTEYILYPKNRTTQPRHDLEIDTGVTVFFATVME